MIILFSVFLVVQDEEGQVKCSKVMCFKKCARKIFDTIALTITSNVKIRPSENLSINCQPLDKLVPPLKIIFFDSSESLAIVRKIRVTQ